MSYRPRRPIPQPRSTSGCLIFAVVPVLIVAAIVFGIANALHVQTMTCTVEEKDRTTNRDGQSDARLYTEECGVLRTQDSLLSWHFSSADTYGSIDEGGTYEVTTRGFRIPWLSMFPNVVEAEEVS